jgi:hypothetical protein
MGSNVPSALSYRADKAAAQRVGPPVVGKSLSIGFDATAKKVDLEGGATYRLVATAAVFIGAAATTTAANVDYLAAGQERILATPAAGMELYATQVTAGGTLYIAKLDDVG